MMKITTLVENTKPPGRRDLQAEFGLSLHIEHGDAKILFDTGASDAFSRNADSLGIDLEAVDLAVLSHHHFDHGGGLATFFERNARARVYMKRSVDGTPFVRAFGLLSRRVGIDPALFERHADRIVFVDSFTEATPGVFLFPDIVSTHPRPEGNRYLYLRKAEGWEHDAFDHELVLAIRETDGVVVFTGCSHCGVLNMVETVAGRFPDAPVKGVVGGFHLLGLPVPGTRGTGRRRIAEMGREMLGYPEARYFTGHCTGRKGLRTLKKVMTGRLDTLTTGRTIEL